MRAYRNVIIAAAFVELVAAGLIAGARANEVRCDGAATKAEQMAGHRAELPKEASLTSAYMVCSDTTVACSP